MQRSLGLSDVNNLKKKYVYNMNCENAVFNKAN